MNSDIKVAYLSQLQDEVLKDSNTILEDFIDAGFATYDEIRAHLSNYGFEGEILNQKIESLSGGEKIYCNWQKFLLAKQTYCFLMNRQAI